MSKLRVLIGTRSLVLDQIVGKGGEGEVHSVFDEPALAVKLYDPKLRLGRRDKINAMVRSELHKRSALAAFPIAVVHMPDGSFGGFLMKLMTGFRPIHELYAPGSRKRYFPQADYRFLARAATNTARAFTSVHLSGCIVGDINHSGIFISKEATATLIDADSFQFTDGNQQYLCSVGVPEYTPPELQSKSFTGVVRTADHDAFGLAIIIFQILLMGRHPFVGTVRRGDIPPLHENIKNFRYVYAENRNVGMDQPPGTPALEDFSPELARLFDYAFSQASIGRRPTAEEWVGALVRFEATLAQCPDNNLHYGPRDALECAWCEMERQIGTVLFLPYLPAGDRHPNGPDLGGTFDLELLWGRVTRLNIPLDRVVPKLPSLSLEPSQAAKDANAATNKTRLSKPAAFWLVAALVLIFAVPSIWVVALLVGFFALANLQKKDVVLVDGAKFKSEYIAAKNQWYRELDGWRNRAEIDSVGVLRERLQLDRQSYLDLDNHEKRMIAEYRNARNERQSRSFLERFDLAGSSIKGVGAGKLATLSSYGIDTAADITDDKLRAVPGFGDVLVGRILVWQSECAAKFMYDASDKDADLREIARIRSLNGSKATSLRSSMVKGVQELESKLRRIQDFSQKEDPLLQKVHERVEQAIKDLNFLSLSIPTVDAPAPVHRKATSVATGNNTRPPYNPPPAAAWQTRLPQSPNISPSVPGSQVAPQCPRCGSLMKKRLSQRGVYAGQPFWGCSRFPVCKGKRPI